MVKGHRISSIKIPFQQKIVDLKLKEMLRKGAIKRNQPAQVEFLSNLFLVGKNMESIAL